MTGTRNALRFWLPTSGPSLFCPCKPFSSKACLGIVKLGGSKTQTNIWHVASGRTAGWRAGPGRDAHRTVRHKDIEETSLEPLSRSTIEGNMYVTRLENTSTGRQLVYLWFHFGNRSALCSLLPTSGPMFFCLCKPSTCTEFPGIHQRQSDSITPSMVYTSMVFKKNPDILCMNRMFKNKYLSAQGFAAS